jgi:hypothetical protein
MVAPPVAAGAPTAIGNVWLVFPSGTTTVAGTVADAVLLARETGSPPAGAGAVSVTVPCSASPAEATGVDKRTFWSVGTTRIVVMSVVVWLPVP